jgi:uncharacterized membrane protein YciS (DUF1049 family)
MKDQTKNIDDKIREALRKEDAELLENYRGEAPFHEMLLDSFRGRNRFLNLMAFVATFIVMALLITSGYQFFQSESTRAMIAWASGFVTCAVATGLLKIWFWLELNKNAITREIKRLELQIANLSRQVKPNSN